MSIPGNQPEQRRGKPDSNESGGQGDPRRDGDLSPYRPGHPQRPGAGGGPPSVSPPPPPPPVVLETRPLPGPPGRGLLAVSSHPATIVVLLLIILLLLVALLWALTRAGSGGGEATPIAPTSATASATPSPVPVFTPSGAIATPTEPGTVEGGVGGPGSPAVSVPALPPFDSSDAEIYSSGTVRLRLNSYGSRLDQYGWRSADGYGGRPNGEGSDFSFGTSGLVGREGTQLALLRDDAPRSFVTCRDQRTWTPTLTWEQLDRGTFVCLRTPDGRRGLMRVDEMPALDDDRPTVEVTGVTWVPIVDK